VRKNLSFTRKIVISLLLLLCATGYAAVPRQRIFVSGTVTDAHTGEAVSGASVAAKELEGVSASSNNYGFYSLSLPGHGSFTVVCSAPGYSSKEASIHPGVDQKIDFALEPVTQLREVVIAADRRINNVTEVQTGIQKLELREISKVPVLFGEQDILKTIQLLPGIRATSEGSSGVTVRGGAADQNLILLDEATVYNASHLMGFFSTFNSDAIRDATIYKGSAPAQFGGRLSSVLDIRMNEGNIRNYAVSGGIGLIASRLNVEGPIVKDRGSFIVSARRTYADIFLFLYNNKDMDGSRLYFYDLNMKANYKLGERDHIYLSGYFGRDVMRLGRQMGIDWGNATATLRWNHIWSHRLFSNTSLIFSNYSYGIMLDTWADLNIDSHIRDWEIKHEFQLQAGDRHTLRFGFNSIYRTITPGQISSSTLTALPRLEQRYSWENALYVSDEWKVARRLNVIYGLRGSSFSVLGPGTFYLFDGNILTGEKTFDSGQIAKSYFNLEPRISANFSLGSTSSLKAGYSRNAQYLHLLSNSGMSRPTDMWLPSSLTVKPEISDMVSLGYFRNFASNKIEASVEGYFKTMADLVDFRDGADITANELVEGELLFGRGRACGIEIYARKKTGRLTGWVSYTLARSTQQIDGINGGRWYPARQDCTHDVSVVAMWSASGKWDLSLTWVYNTGNAVTFPSGKYDIDGTPRLYFSGRNGSRMPAYHRLDLGATLYVRRTERFESSWNFSLYNAYGHRNAFMIDFRQSEADPTVTEAVNVSLFRWVPSITYNFKFK